MLQRLKFVEFLEFVGRISIVKFNGTEMQDLSLVQKLEYIIDDLFVLISAKRLESVSE